MSRFRFSFIPFQSSPPLSCSPVKKECRTFSWSSLFLSFSSPPVSFLSSTKPLLSEQHSCRLHGVSRCHRLNLCVCPDALMHKDTFCTSNTHNHKSGHPELPPFLCIDQDPFFSPTHTTFPLTFSFCHNRGKRSNEAGVAAMMKRRWLKKQEQKIRA